MIRTVKKPLYVKKGGLLRKKVQKAKIDLNDDSPYKTEVRVELPNISEVQLHEVT